MSLKRLKEGYQIHLNGNDNIDEETIKNFKQEFLEAINDDLNMPQAMSVVWNIIRHDKKSKQLAELLLDFDKILGLDIDKIEEEKQELPEEVLKIIEERKQARANKDWNLSDELRDKLIDMGYSVKDTKDGMEVNKI